MMYEDTSFLTFMSCVYGIGGLLVASLCGYWGARVGEDKGNRRIGFWLGFFFGPLGLLVVALLPDTDRRVASAHATWVDPMRITGYVGHCPDCGVDVELIGDFRCPAHPGVRISNRWLKPASWTHQPAHTHAASDSPAGQIRELKALLDEGIITSDEFEAKKRSLLGL